MVLCLFSVCEPRPEEVSMVRILGRVGCTLVSGIGHRTPHVSTVSRKYLFTTVNVLFYPNILISH